MQRKYPVLGAVVAVFIVSFIIISFPSASVSGGYYSMPAHSATVTVKNNGILPLTISRVELIAPDGTALYSTTSTTLRAGQESMEEAMGQYELNGNKTFILTVSGGNGIFPLSITKNVSISSGIVIDNVTAYNAGNSTYLVGHVTNDLPFLLSSISLTANSREPVAYISQGTLYPGETGLYETAVSGMGNGSFVAVATGQYAGRIFSAEVNVRAVKAYSSMTASSYATWIPWYGFTDNITWSVSLKDTSPIPIISATARLYSGNISVASLSLSPAAALGQNMSGSTTFIYNTTAQQFTSVVVAKFADGSMQKTVQVIAVQAPKIPQTNGPQVKINTKISNGIWMLVFTNTGDVPVSNITAYLMVNGSRVYMRNWIAVFPLKPGTGGTAYIFVPGAVPGDAYAINITYSSGLVQKINGTAQ